MICHNIEDIKNKNILCLDFDDCILPSDRQLPISNPAKFDLIVGNNIGGISKFIKEYQLDIFIISSWSEFLTYNKESEKLEFFDKKLYKRPYYSQSIKHLEYLSPYIIGFSPYGNRIDDIENLSKNNNFIVVVDDAEHLYQDINSLGKNILYIPTFGMFNYKLASDKLDFFLKKISKKNNEKTSINNGSLFKKIFSFFK